MKGTKKIPSFLQPVLWSVGLESLDLKKDKVYVINQVLSFGTLPMIKWLFTVYPRRVIRQVFVNHPIREYTPSRFNLVKNYLLHIKEKLNPHRYVQDFP